MNPDLFRKESLEHLASPERLDSLMVLVKPRAWIALSACLAAILAGLAWGIFGHATDEAVGVGVLEPEGGIYDVDAPAPGELSQVMASVHSQVARGALVARIAQDALVKKLQEAEAQLGRLRQHRAEAGALQARERALQEAAIEHKLAQLKVTRGAAEARTVYLEERVGLLRAALAKGVISDEQYQAGVQDLAEARDLLAGTGTAAKDLAGQKAALQTRDDQQSFELDQAIRAAEAELAALRADLARGTEVRSPLDGTVTEVLLDPGQRVEPGATILRLGDTSSPLMVFLFVPTHGRWLSPGQRVELEPAGFPREEFGALVGTIREVSPTPQSLEAVDEVTRNHLLASRLAGSGDTYEVEVRPEPDPRTPSGFRWTNGKGPGARFGMGTLVTGRIRIRQQAPIQEVIPALKKWLGWS